MVAQAPGLVSGLRTAADQEVCATGGLSYARFRTCLTVPPWFLIFSCSIISA